MEKICPICNLPVDPDASVCPACGFRLIESTQAFKPISTDEIESAPEFPQRSIRLTVVRGPQVGNAFVLGNSPISVGRSPECDLFLNDRTVSRHHARIEPTPEGYVIIDNHSFNGTWINNQNVSEPTVLHDGDMIQLGAFFIAVSM